jgi:signal transduction histidine kinase
MVNGKTCHYEKPVNTHILAIILRISLLTAFTGLGRAERNAEIGPLDRLAAFFSGDLGQLDSQIAELNQQLAVTPELQFDQQQRRIGFRTPNNPKPGPKWVTIDLGEITPIHAIAFVGTYVKENPGYGFPQKFRIETALKEDFSDVHVVYEWTDRDFPDLGYYPFVYKVPPDDRVTARWVRISSDQLWRRPDPNRPGGFVGDRVLAIGEVFVISNGINVAASRLPHQLEAPEAESGTAWGIENLTDGQSILGVPIVHSLYSKPGFQSRLYESPRPKDAPWICVDLGAVYTINQLRLYPTQSLDDPGHRGYALPRVLKIEISTTADFTTPTMERKVWEYAIGAETNTGENVITYPMNNTAGRYVKLTGLELGKVNARLDPGKPNNPGQQAYSMALAELEVMQDRTGVNVAFDKAVTSSTPSKNLNWSPVQLVDGYTSQGKIIPLMDWLNGLDSRRGLQQKTADLITRRESVAKGVVNNIIRWAVGLVIGLVTLAIWLNIRSLLAKRKALEALRNRIARDIHDEVGSGLGTITLLSEMAQEGDSDDMRQDLSEIHKISASLAQGMRDIVWFNRADVDSVRDLIMKMRETAETMLARHQLHFETVGEDFVRPINMERRREIFLLYKEALHNILKHASAKNVHIRTGIEGLNFFLQIRDDGKGFDPERGTSGAGMGSMKQRAETLRATMQLDTNHGQGTQLTLRAKLK